MKRIGTVAEYAAQRNQELKQALRTALGRRDCHTLEDCYKAAVAMPASRFWVGERRAADVISLMRRGRQLRNMKPKTREMYMELHRRAMAYMRANPQAGIAEAAFEAVNSPAPEFYITPKSARVILSRARNRSL